MSIRQEINRRHILIAALVIVAAVCAPAFSADSLVVTPSAPTTADAIDFALFSTFLDCCGAVHNQSVQVSDTTIDLFYQYANSSVCDCIVAGKWIDFKNGPLQAGTYGVYSAPSIYCAPGTAVACPDLVVAPQRVGQITVTPSGTSVVKQGATLRGQDPALVLREQAGKLVIANAHALAGEGIAKIYDSRGRLCAAAPVSEAGDIVFDAASWPAGMYVVQLGASGQALATTFVLHR